MEHLFSNNEFILVLNYATATNFQSFYSLENKIKEKCREDVLKAMALLLLIKARDWLREKNPKQFFIWVESGFKEVHLYIY